MTHLSKETRRRIGKLQRHAHAFHRFAHHPLCGAYASEVIRVGHKTRVCRGCVTSCAGLGLGIGFALLTRLGGPAIAALLPVAMLLALTRRRLPKLLTRAIPAFLLSSSVCRMLQEPSATLGIRMFQEPSGMLLAAVLAAGFATFLLYRRRGPERSPCLGCPERGLEKVCSGFQPIDLAERAFVRRAHRLIDQRAG